MFTLRQGLLILGLAAPFVAGAQSASPEHTGRLETVLVTATKQADAVAAQNVPIAVTAFDSEALTATFTTDINALTVSMPNVQLDGVGTQKATANFTIRGLGTNSSIPSIEPTVGTFYDGVYMGINAGIIHDFFDIQSIEVLRGPQGLLFGRNVTGGAIVINTREPSAEPGLDMRVSTTDRLDSTVAASLTGPLVDGLMNGRLTALYNNDEGWFENEFNGEDFGKSKTLVLRPSLILTPAEGLDVTLRYEYGNYDGQGSASQNRGPGLGAFEGAHDRHSFSFNVDEEGFGHSRWDMAVVELNYQVGPGTLTNVFGWRQYSDDSLSDLDGRPLGILHWQFLTDQEQFSNELRYAANFERVNFTAGLYWFTQDLDYLETRLVPTSTTDPVNVPTTVGHLGGIQYSRTRAAFASVDVKLAEQWTLNLGARYTEENKNARVADFGTQANGLDPCPGLGFRRDVGPDQCTLSFPAPGDVGSKQWTDLTPKIGLQYFVNDDIQLYTFATDGFRSGGYNLRNTVAGVKAGPFDPEEQRSYELGMKADWLDQRLRTNVAVFYNEIDEMQREINVPTAAGGGGIGQSIRNTADAIIKGAELELVAALPGELLVRGNVGYVDGNYRRGSLRFDISGDGQIDSVDEGLDIPRLARLTWGLELNHTLNFASDRTLRSYVSFNHRDRAAFTDNNLGTLNTVDMLNAGITLSLLGDQLTIGAFGRNLTNQVIEGNESPLAGAAYSAVTGTVPRTVFGTYAPLAKGRVYGIELNYRL